MRPIYLGLGAAIFHRLNAQFPTIPEGITLLKSKYHEGVKISYKEPGLCETTPGVKSYSGYVHLPPGLLSDIAGETQSYPINTVFWFFESRKSPNNAPLSIWLNGGAGGSSMMGLLQENGPCFVGADSNSTYLNPWSWNSEVNMLYIDQPTHAGFSYDVPSNGTLIMEEGIITLSNFTDDIPIQNLTHRIGTFSSQSGTTTSNSTIHAAHAIWHFAQTWFSEFPAYKPADDRVSLWTESYGGHYGPQFLEFFQDQNERIKNGTIKEKGTKYIHLDTLGIVNGFLDSLIQMPAYAYMAWNNTYGIKAFTKPQYRTALNAWSKQGGCRDQTIQCQELGQERDPNYLGRDPEVNKICSKCFDYCAQAMVYPYLFDTNNGWLDIAHPKADPFPEPYLHGYLFQSWVQEALGVPVNYAAQSMVVASAFDSVGDWTRRGSLEAVARLLDSGIKVHLVYSDCDFANNWIGGELVSLAVNYSGSRSFKSAGYALIATLDGVGGMVYYMQTSDRINRLELCPNMVRQYGNFSFSGIFQAGHEVPSYAPEISYAIFMRSLFNKDIASGLLPVSDSLKTLSPSNTWHMKNTVPPRPKPRCYVLYPQSCTPDLWEKVKNGSVIIKDFIVVDDGSEDDSIDQTVIDDGATFVAQLSDSHGETNGGKYRFAKIESTKQRILDMPEWRRGILKGLIYQHIGLPRRA